MIRCKMRCTKVSQVAYAYGPGNKPAEHEQVELSAVAGPGNEDWAKFTPSGSVQMNINKEGAIGQFKVGQDYFVDFTPAPAPEGQ